MSVVILGGGPAGLATAIALANRQIPVRVIESQDYRQFRGAEHLPPQGVMELLTLTSPQNWRLDHANCGAVESSWGSERLQRVEYTQPINYGLNLSRPEFDRQLAAYARRQGVDIRTNSQCLSSQFQDDQSWKLLIQDGNSKYVMQSRFVVDATGRKAVFARSQHKYPVYFDNTVALVARLRPKDSRPQQRHSFLVEAVEHGWWYFLTLEADQPQALAVFFTDEDLIIPGKNRSWRTWKQGFRHANHLRNKLLGYTCFGKIQGFHMTSQTLPNPRGPGWIAVGDAALAFDPLISKGMAKDFTSAQRDADIISNYLEGQVQSLDHYRNFIRDDLARFLRIRHEYYKTERRWATATFWQRRQEKEDEEIKQRSRFESILSRFERLRHKADTA